MNFNDALASAAKGAAAGAAAGPVGAAVGGLVADIAPEVGRWLFGSGTGQKTAALVAQAVEAVQWARAARYFDHKLARISPLPDTHCTLSKRRWSVIQVTDWPRAHFYASCRPLLPPNSRGRATNVFVHGVAF